MVAYSFQRRFVVPIKLGLGLSYALDDIVGDIEAQSRPKRHTIRAIGLRRHAMPGDQLQLYCGMRSPACFLIGRAECSDVKTIYIKIREDAELQFRIDDKWLSDRKAEAFAKSDGFGSIEDMWLFWRKEHKGVADFGGFVIEWQRRK